MKKFTTEVKVYSSNAIIAIRTDNDFATVNLATDLLNGNVDLSLYENADEFIDEQIDYDMGSATGQDVFAEAEEYLGITIPREKKVTLLQEAYSRIKM